MPPQDHQEQSDAKAGTTDSKGKNKDETSTMAERISNSGRAMLGSLLTPDHQAPSATALAGKGSGSSGSSGYTATAGPGRGQIIEAASARAGSVVSGQGEQSATFRSLQPQEDGPSQAFDHFMSANPSLELSGPGSSIQAHGEAVSEDIAEQEAADGRAVFDLLSQPDQESDWMPDQSTMDLVPAASARLRSVLFDDDFPWYQLLNFSPNFSGSASGSHSEAAEELMGTPDIKEAEHLWWQQWKEVLSSYTDEVWGDLAQMVAEAKKEATEQAAGQYEGPAEGKALARLRQILAHVRGSV